MCKRLHKRRLATRLLTLNKLAIAPQMSLSMIDKIMNTRFHKNREMNDTLAKSNVFSPIWLKNSSESAFYSIMQTIAQIVCLIYIKFVSSSRN